MGNDQELGGVVGNQKNYEVLSDFHPCSTFFLGNRNKVCLITA